jgi:maltooligosyltrehalose trehalohydrolase
MIQKVGAQYWGDKTAEFVVWAPLIDTLELHIESPGERLIAMSKDEQGYWRTVEEQVQPGSRYMYCFSGKDHPDPASYYQPGDVFKSSSVVDHSAFDWQDKDWKGIPLRQLIIYELHVGTFTPEGTFKSVINKLPYLKDLGINAIELMPVGQFPGARNWGYDGVFPFAAQCSYGGPDGFKDLVNACHAQGFAVILDVVYNHVGPEGNVLDAFMPLFSSKYKTPWGQAINFDDEYSYGVRNFFMANAVYWLNQYHLDGLRLDAVHGIYDMSAQHFLRELAMEVRLLASVESREIHLIAESDLNDIRMIESLDSGGNGMGAQWNDDYHHSVHTLLTGEDKGYYADFGSTAHLAKALKLGWTYTWDFSASRKRHHGSPLKDPVPPEKLIVYMQNHDQIGNRLNGERLCTLVSFEGQKLAAASILCGPFIPMIFMGEEYGEKSPFLYFMSHYSEDLIKAVQDGRKKEFAVFGWQQEPPDPYSIQTFERSRLKWDQLKTKLHKTLLSFYSYAIGLRKSLKPLMAADVATVEEIQGHKIISMHRRHQNQETFVLFNFSDSRGRVAWRENTSWQLRLDSSDKMWLGPGTALPQQLAAQCTLSINPLSCIVYERLL